MPERKVRGTALIKSEVVPEQVARFLSASAARRGGQHVFDGSTYNLTEGDALFSCAGNCALLQWARKDNGGTVRHNFAYKLAITM
jgi:hypothetical protein